MRSFQSATTVNSQASDSAQRQSNGRSYMFCAVTLTLLGNVMSESFPRHFHISHLVIIGHADTIIWEALKTAVSWRSNIILSWSNTLYQVSLIYPMRPTVSSHSSHDHSTPLGPSLKGFAPLSHAQRTLCGLEIDLQLQPTRISPRKGTKNLTHPLWQGGRTAKTTMKPAINLYCFFLLHALT